METDPDYKQKMLEVVIEALDKGISFAAVERDIAAGLAAKIDDMRQHMLKDMLTFPEGSDEAAAVVCNMVPPGFTAAALRDAVRHYIRQYATVRNVPLDGPGA